MNTLPLRLARTAVLAVLLFQSAPTVATAHAETLVINASQEAPYHTPDGTGFEDRLIIEMFGRLGTKVRIHDVPSQRGLTLLDHGIDDGTLARNPVILETYKNIVMVAEKALDREYHVFTKDPRLRPAGWQSLAPYHVGAMNGWRVVERNLPAAATLTKVNDHRQLFRLLEIGRVDVVIFNRWGGLQILRDLGLREARMAEPALAKDEVFFFLHKRHATLADRAADALRETKRDGTYDRLVAEVLLPLTR